MVEQNKDALVSMVLQLIRPTSLPMLSALLCNHAELKIYVLTRLQFPDSSFYILVSRKCCPACAGFFDNLHDCQVHRDARVADYFRIEGAPSDLSGTILEF